MSNPKDNRIKQLEERLESAREQNTKLLAICQRQRDSLAAQQEAIVQVNVSLDGTLACLAEKYGEDIVMDGTPTKRLTIPTEAYPGVLDRLEVHAVIEGGEYVITVSERTQEKPAENAEIRPEIVQNKTEE